MVSRPLALVPGRCECHRQCAPYALCLSYPSGTAPYAWSHVPEEPFASTGSAADLCDDNEHECWSGEKAESWDVVAGNASASGCRVVNEEFAPLQYSRVFVSSDALTLYLRRSVTSPHHPDNISAYSASVHGFWFLMSGCDRPCTPM